MPQRKDVPSLVAAAMALDDELRAFDDLAREAKEKRANSQKALSRTAAILSDSVEARARIEEGVRALVGEIEKAQGRQVASIQILIEVAGELEKRTQTRDELLARFGALGASAGQVNTLATELAVRRQDGADEREILERLQEIQLQMTGVAAEASALTEAADTSGWPEIARQADAVRQQVNAVKSKLSDAQRSIAASAPS